ncbi:hypothetical protein ACFWY6_12745 [Streptomyces sp. NPDC059037]|uniref:hypothetical protein n=1 Tax=Streptomyces sp. NPDC059037 TaxID=3346710 RepID=UPI0036824CDC
MRIRKASAIGATALVALSGIAMAPAAHAKGSSISTKVYKFYPGGGAGTTRTGEIDFTVTTVTKGSGAIERVTGSLSGHNNVQGQALGIKMDFTQPYVVAGDSNRQHLRGKVVLQSCLAKHLPVCGPSSTVTFDAIVNRYGPQSPAKAKSSNTKLWPIYKTK